jgi:hypothetical protein
LHRFRRYTPRALVAAGVIAAGAFAAAPASAATAHIHCAGTADGCVASVGIAGGASNKTVIITLTDTNFQRVGRRVIPRNSKAAFSMKNGRFARGGSEYIFTLNAVKANPKGARIILLFAAGVAA